MRRSAETLEEQCDCAGIIGALAEVALGKPLAAFDQLIAEAYEVLPPDLWRRLATYDLEEEARTGARFRSG